MRVWLKRLGFIIVIVLLVLLGIGVYCFFKSRTPETGTLHLRGLKGEVTVTRDQYGIPHIVARQSDLDAFYALGYVQAQDRFWQMEFQRHVAAGTLSELFGSATLKEDEYLRTWGFYRAAESAWSALSPQSKAIIQSYSDGVNAFLSQKRYPLQMMLLNDHPKPWTNIDSIAWQKMMAWDLQNVWKAKLKNYLIAKKLGADQISVVLPAYPKNGTTVLSDEDLKQSGLYTANEISSFLSAQNGLGRGSNNWVVSGKWTTSGHPLLANDPHLALQAPALWYLVELKGPTLHVTGASIPGVPVVVLGHNDHIAWGATNVNPDVQDLYILNKDSAVHTINEVIHIRGKPDVIYPVEISDEGPVISNVTEAGQISKNVALKWTALMPGDTTVQSMLEVDYAKNWREFTQALQNLVVPSQNFVYADTEGNIGYYLPGKIPIRRYDSRFPVPDDAAHQWQGYIPFAQLPHVFNPPEGYIVSANNRVVSEHYPYAITFRWSDPQYRAERIVQLLQENKPLDKAKFEKIQLDTLSLQWKDLAPLLLKTKPLDAQSQQALDLLKDWDGNASLGSIQKTVFAYWYREIEKMEPKFVTDLSTLPEPDFIVQQLETNGKYCDNCQDFLSASLQSGMQKLTADLGNDPRYWEWRRVHRAKFTEVGLGTIKVIGNIWNRSVGAPGGLFSVNVGMYHFDDFDDVTGPGYRQIIDLGDFNSSEFMMCLGQSEDVFSSHYDDLMRPWREGKYLPMAPTESSHDKVLTLSPKIPKNL